MSKFCLGTGKTYTISLSLLRLAELQHRLKLEVSSRPKIVFITAMTHAAIDACRNKLLRLITNYRSIDSLTTEWLDDLQVEQVIKGNEHPAPAKIGVGMHIYTGTIYQVRWLFKFLNPNGPSFETQHTLSCIILQSDIPWPWIA